MRRSGNTYSYSYFVRWRLEIAAFAPYANDDDDDDDVLCTSEFSAAVRRVWCRCVVG